MNAQGKTKEAVPRTIEIERIQTGVRLEIKAPRDLASVKKLAVIKLEN